VKRSRSFRIIVTYRWSDVSSNAQSNEQSSRGQSSNDKSISLKVICYQDLPASITQLKHLRILKLAYNRLASFPEDFGTLKSLEILDLTSNQLNEYSLTTDFFQLSTSLNGSAIDNDPCHFCRKFTSSVSWR
jgi:Leucine-rich repeat (LRR) protein